MSQKITELALKTGLLVLSHHNGTDTYFVSWDIKQEYIQDFAKAILDEIKTLCDNNCIEVNKIDDHFK